MMVFFVAFFPLLVGLGTWQLNRAAEKRSLESKYLEQLTKLPVAPTLTNLTLPFARVALHGRYTDETYLVDNQVRGGVVGYWVVQAFVAKSGVKVLVNRGFLAAPAVRSEFPVVPVVTDEVSIVATVWPDLGLIPEWSTPLPESGWPRREQRLDVTRFAAATTAFPAQLRLEAGQPSVLQPAPFAARLSDDKHNGYALTWFGLAATLLIAFIRLAMRGDHRQQATLTPVSPVTGDN